MRFFKKKKQSEASISSINVELEEKDKKITINDLYWMDYDVNILNAKEIIVEVYRESKMEEDWEVPGTFIGIRLFEDGELKQDIVLHDFANYGLFSYTSVQRHKSEIIFVISIADFIASKIIYGYEHMDSKIKKRFVSGVHIYDLKVPSEYVVEMPEGNERLLEKLELDKMEYEIQRKREKNPDADLSELEEKYSKEFEKHSEKWFKIKK